MEDKEIIGRLPPRIQALLSKTHKAIADERKYKSILYPITDEEIENVYVREFYVLAGTQDNHVVTKWSLETHINNFSRLNVESSHRVADGVTREFGDGTLTEFAVKNIFEAFELCELFTGLAYEVETLNDSNFDYINVVMRKMELKEDTQTRILFSIKDLYIVYALRCRDVYLNEEEYVLKVINDYWEEFNSFVPELVIDPEEEISEAKYLLSYCHRQR
jgi:hypothetical protein